jgi:hypothetical protein
MSDMFRLHQLGKCKCIFTETMQVRSARFWLGRFQLQLSQLITDDGCCVLASVCF